MSESLELVLNNKLKSQNGALVGHEKYINQARETPERL